MLPLIMVLLITLLFRTYRNRVEYAPGTPMVFSTYTHVWKIPFT
ncbi:MAG: hypothetical protein WC341_13845 [Bacteroidales bacterium]